MRRSAIALLLFSASAACGLAFSPGDYREPGESDAGPILDGNVIIVEGGPNEGGAVDAGPTRTNIALFAGRRDPVSGEAAQVAIAETMLTSIDSTGALGPITFDAPPPTPAAWTHAGILAGRVYVHNASTLAFAPFTDHVNGGWNSAPIPAANPAGLRPWVLDSFGALSGRPSGDGTAYVATFADGGVGAWTALSATATVVRGNTRLVLGGTNVYIVGGDTPASEDNTAPAIPAHAEIEVGKLVGDGGDLGDFHTTTSLPAVGDGGAFAAFDPIAVASADHLYVLGGNTTAAAVTDQAFAAKVKDPKTGDLDAWVTLPKLPQPMNGFAAVVTPSWLVIVGGQLAASKPEDKPTTTDVILRLAIKPDGTFGTSWETAGRLPSGRSAVVGVTY